MLDECTAHQIPGRGRYCRSTGISRDYDKVKATVSHDHLAASAHCRKDSHVKGLQARVSAVVVAVQRLTG